MEVIGGGAFYGSSAKALVIGRSVRRIGTEAFQGCPLSEIAVFGSPADIAEDAFHPLVYRHGTLVVESEYERKYYNSKGWENFYDIRGIL